MATSPSSPRVQLWSDMTRSELAAARDRNALVLIPTGSIEQHADHLPVKTDTELAAKVTERAAMAVRETEVVVAPPVAFGFTPHHQSWPGTISLRLDTYLAMLGDIARSVIASGFPRALFINGHGGNIAPLRALVGELITDGYPVGTVDYFAPARDKMNAHLSGGLPGVGHACEAETALIMALGDKDRQARIAEAAGGLSPRLIQPWIAPGHGADPITEGGAGWAAIFHGDDCGYYGDPAAATVECGEALLDLMARELAVFIEGFSRTPLRIGVARDPAKPMIAAPIAGPPD